MQLCQKGKVTMASTGTKISVEPAMTQTIASKEIYLKEVVVLTKNPTNKEKLGRALSEDIKSKKYPKDTTFYLICGFHTKPEGEVSKSDHELTKQFEEMIIDLKVVIDANRDMGYKFAQEIELKSIETGMHILLT